MVEIRFITPDDGDAFRDAISFGFGRDPITDADFLEHYWDINDIATRIGAFDRGRVVATFGSFDLDLTMPGHRSLPMAGTTQVTVHPTHRRRGILSQMMAMHLDQARERQQPLAGLWASEETIYGRFGYGPAIWSQELRLPAGRAVAAPSPDDVDVYPLDVDQARPIVTDLYQRSVLDHPGRYPRSPLWWEVRHFLNPETRWHGGRNRRYLVAERAGEPVGSLMYVNAQGTAENDWVGTTQIIEMTALDDGARRALLHVATNVDLYRNVHWAGAPIDEPLVVELDRFRSTERRLYEAVWLRPLDVVACLAGRTYERPGTVVLDVCDDTARGVGPAAGRYRLHVGDTTADNSSAVGPGAFAGPAHEPEVEITTVEPDVTLSAATLGRLLAGGGSGVTLGRAGLIEGNPAAIANLDRLFATVVAPHCPEVF